MSVVRSMTDKMMELSRRVVTAPAYGQNRRWSGVDQVDVLMVTANAWGDIETRRFAGEVSGLLLMPALAGFLAVRVAMA